MERKHTHLKGPEFSRIIAGAWRWGNGAPVAQLIMTSLEAGITSFDHADIYGDYSCEAVFGKAFESLNLNRSQMQLITKCGIKLISTKYPSTSVKHYDTSRKHILDSVENSLKNLRTDYVDLLLIHRPDPLMDSEEVSETFGLLKQSGKVLHFGVSNFTATQFEALQSYLPFPLVTNQIEISLGRPDAMFDGTLDMLAKHRVSPMAWSPLAGGKLMSHSPELWSCRGKYQATETQLTLAWLLNHPATIFPVIGTTQPVRITEAAASVNVQVDRQDWFEMLKVARGVDVP